MAKLIRSINGPLCAPILGRTTTTELLWELRTMNVPVMLKMIRENVNRRARLLWRHRWKPCMVGAQPTDSCTKIALRSPWGLPQFNCQISLYRLKTYPRLISWHTRRYYDIHVLKLVNCVHLKVLAHVRFWRGRVMFIFIHRCDEITHVRQRTLRGGLRVNPSWWHDDVIKWKRLPRYWPFV